MDDFKPGEEAIEKRSKKIVRIIKIRQKNMIVWDGTKERVVTRSLYRKLTKLEDILK